MANEKTPRARARVLAIYPEAFPDPSNPVMTTAILNAQYDDDTPANEAARVFNITCAIDDSAFTADITEPETSDARTLCDEGERQTKLYDTYEVSFDIFRHENVIDSTEFNLAFSLFNGPDRPYYIAVSVGKPSDAPFVVGDDVSLFGVTTDNPVDLVDSGEMLRLGARFQNTGLVLQNVRLAA